MEIILSAAALLVAIVLGVLHYRLAHRVGKIEHERRVEELEARGRADVAAFFEPAGGSSTVNFVLLNRGPAVAHDVSFEMRPVDGERMTLGSEPMPPLPPVLDAGQSFKILHQPMMGEARVVDVELSWRAEAGQQRKSLRLNVC